MGKKKTVLMDESAKESEPKKKVSKKIEQKKSVILSKLEKKETVEKTTKVKAEKSASAESKKAGRIRGKKYVSARSQVDKTRLYPIESAVALAKKTHVGKFPGSLEAHAVVKETGLHLKVSFPHATGKTVQVAIATDEVLAEIEKGMINFSVLIAHPSLMPKIAKYARVLGPKGLMPNPKNGTITSNPEQKKKEFETGAVIIKTERKAPLVHILIGKLNQPDTELAENLHAFLKAFPPGKLVKCTISASMSPGIKIALE